MSNNQKLNLLAQVDRSLRPNRYARNMYLFNPTNIEFDDYDSILTEPYSNALFNLPVKSIYVVPVNRENRMDLISYDIYKDVRYWWLLCEYNNIYNPFLVDVGTEIAYFDMEDAANLFLLRRDEFIDKAELELTHEF